MKPRILVVGVQREKYDHSTHNISTSSRPVEMLKAANACQENAEQFVKDAEILIENSSFGHAFSLLVLADEEMGKSLMYIFSLRGFPLKKSFLRGHEKKQFIQLIMTLAWMIFDVLHLEDIMKIAKEEKDSEKRVTQVTNALEEAVMAGMKEVQNEFPRMTDEITASYTGLDAKKQRGLYVDIDDNGQIMTPDDIPKEEVLQYLDSVKNRLSKMRYIVLSEEEIELVDGDGLRLALEKRSGENITEKIQEFVKELERIGSR